jgi:diguanylate cyclase (GGDEF)-like protein
MTDHRRATSARRIRNDFGRRRLEVLYDVTRRLAAVHERDDILAFIVNEAARVLEAEAASLRLLEGDELVTRALTESAAALMMRSRLKIGESLSGRVVASGQPVAVEDLSQDTRYDAQHKRAAMEHGFHGFLGMPLRANDTIIGVINLYTKSCRRFTPDEISLLSAFADQASLAIDKDRLLREARQRTIRLRALARLSQVVSSSLNTADVLGAIARAAADLMGVPAVGVWIADEERRTLELRGISDDRFAVEHPARHLTFDQGPAGWVAAQGRVLNSPDMFSEPHTLNPDWLRANGVTSGLFTPIVFHDSLLGVLGMYGTSPFQLRPDDQELMDGFVAQAAIAIRNARLFEQLRLAHTRLEERARDLDLLTRMAEVLQACVTEEEAYIVVGRFGGQFFPRESGAVFITSASRNLVEARAMWGAFDVDSAMFKPEDCWALRRGRAHVVDDTGSGLLCQHLPGALPSAYLCIPLMAQGESLGILYLSVSVGSDEPGAGWTETKQGLTQTIAEQLGLAVANLKLRDTLKNQSIRDPLTGIFNRRYMEETLERELRRAERSRHFVGVMMVDLDHFKEFNDTYGHEAGDVLLRDLGRLLRSNMRGEDVACRYGGDEFVLILPEASPEATLRRGEQLREALKRLHVSHRGQLIGGVSMSVGIACFPDHGATGEALLHAADTALYAAKNGGRDRVIISRGGPGMASPAPQRSEHPGVAGALD